MITPEVLSRQWSPGGKRVLSYTHRNQHTSVTEKSLGGGIRISCYGTALEYVELKNKAYLHYTHPGLHSVYFHALRGRVTVGESPWDVVRRSGDHATLAEPGVVYVFGGEKVKKYRGDVAEIPEIDHGRTMDQARKEFWDLLCVAAEDSYRLLGGGPVGLLLSAGTDSSMVLLALREIGAEVVTFSSGRSWDDFDPHWARIYTRVLGMSDPILGVIPEDEDLLQGMLDATLAEIQQSDFGNVLMAICNRECRLRAQEQGLKILYHGYYGDSLLGCQPGQAGRCKARCDREGVEASAEEWAKDRFDSFMGTYPNNRQIALVSRQQGMDWRALFTDRKLIDYALSCPLGVAPLEHHKALYHEVMAGRLPETSWQAGCPKVGFYTGSGISKIRLKSSVLQDANMRASYARVKEKLL